ncbi:hypothetical protein G7Y89_g3868 [Cudoniella acicularis]|uniref:Alcohol dehydrogenase-like C-terminal domain-containing protein n=1 Tax=Cudoniella acicularis TaxID=354080 RepID=A0A8H4W785_9HELO|nr:hypothetical protein G7Y89_g3868 [Cudoniella acicularis]
MSDTLIYASEPYISEHETSFNSEETYQHTESAILDTHVSAYHMADDSNNQHPPPNDPISSASCHSTAQAANAAHGHSGLGIAFVTAILALGVCLGCDFTPAGSPNLRKILREIKMEAIPTDQREECLQESGAPRQGDWILIWGGSSTSAHILAQLTKLDTPILVDSHDNARATEIIRRVTDRKLRFAADTIGGSTAGLAQSYMWQDSDDSHLVGLSGLPKEAAPGVRHHTVPIKVIMRFLKPPDTEVAPMGVEGVNDALDRMRRDEVPGKRVVVKFYTL